MMQRIFKGLLWAALAVQVAKGSTDFTELGESPYDFAQSSQQVPFGLNLKKKIKQVFEKLPSLDPKHREHAPDKTIYQALSVHPEFSRLTKVLNFSEDIVSILNDTNADVTFFAVPNSALPHKHDKGKKPKHHDEDESDLTSIPHNLGLAEIIQTVEDLEDSSFDDDDDDDDEKKERRKKFIKHLVKYLLSYHILPTGLSSHQLALNTTFATSLSLKDGSLDNEPLRVKVSTAGISPVPTLNFFSKVVKADLKFLNGVVHVINHPLIPPPSIFQELFLIQGHFSTLTSAALRVGVDSELERRWTPGKDGEKGSIEGATAVTFFAPTISAFKKLPFKLRVFLFSPFGERVLKKLLQLHIAPDVILHSDYFHDASSSSDVEYNGSWANELDLSDDMAEFMTESIYSIDGEDAMAEFLDFETSDHPHHDEDEDDHPPPPPHGHHGHHGHHDEEEDDHSPYHRHHDDHHDRHHDEDHDDPHHRGLRKGKGKGKKNCKKGPKGSKKGKSRKERKDRKGKKDDHPRRPKHPKHPKHSIPKLPHPSPYFAVNFTLPSLVTNHSLSVHIAKFNFTLPVPGHHTISKLVTKFFVSGVEVPVPDIPARNGAVHPISSLINPHRQHHGPPHKKPKEPKEFRDEFEFMLGGGEVVDEVEEGWEDWEEWLPEWAAEE